MRRYVALLVCAALAGCARSSAPVELSPALAGAANTLEVTMIRATPSDAAIDMPDMPMPPKIYALHAAGLHTYEASSVAFSMAGTWRVTLRDRRGTPLRSFTVTVR